jgi:hypothetical protein
MGISATAQSVCRGGNIGPPSFATALGIFWLAAVVREQNRKSAGR